MLSFCTRSYVLKTSLLLSVLFITVSCTFKTAAVQLGLFVGIPAACAVLILFVVAIIVCYRHQKRIKQRAALIRQVAETVHEAIRPRPTVIIHMESEDGQSRPQEGENELPVAQGPSAYEAGTKVPPSFEKAIEKAIVHSIVARLFEQGNSGYQRFENV